jgi:hypothetical protein
MLELLDNNTQLLALVTIIISTGSNNLHRDLHLILSQLTQIDLGLQLNRRHTSLSFPNPISLHELNLGPGLKCTYQMQAENYKWRLAWQAQR